MAKNLLDQFSFNELINAALKARFGANAVVSRVLAFEAERTPHVVRTQRIFAHRHPGYIENHPLTGEPWAWKNVRGWAKANGLDQKASGAEMHQIHEDICMEREALQTPLTPGKIDIHPDLHVAFGVLSDFVVSPMRADGVTYLASRAAVESVGEGANKIDVMLVKIDETLIAVTMKEAAALGLPEESGRWYQPKVTPRDIAKMGIKIDLTPAS